MKIPHKVLGAVFVALLLLGVYASYGMFTQKFSSFDDLTLRTSVIGLQLPKKADVKIRGVIIGQVEDFKPTPDGVDVKLGIFPDKLHLVPSNVTGSIVPKTLFGEKYVSLIIPDNASPSPIKVGGVIPRTQVSIEVEKVLSDLYPLLETVQPAQLNYTLNAIATALEGRGGAIGNNIEVLDGYLKRLNPQIPQIIQDLKLTASVSDTYSSVMPQVATILRNTITTMNTLKDRSAKLHQLFTDVASFSDTATAFLDKNGDNLISLSQLSAAQLRLFAHYAPEYPCLMAGIVKAGKLQAQAFRGFTLHINLETLPHQPRGYTRADTPVYGDSIHGPTCLHLPNPAGGQAHPVGQPNFVDGVDSPTGKGTDRTAPGWGQYAGSPSETGLLKALIAPTMGEAPGDLGDLGPLLVAPMARGAEVSTQ